MITNTPPSQITSWSVEGGIRSFVVSIPTAPPDNDLAGIIVIGKAGAGQNPVFPDDVFYRGPWSDLIVVDTDASNNALLPNQAYTIKVAAFDGFGTSSLNFSTALEVVTLQLVEDDIADEAVTNNKIPDNEIQSAKISGLVADKITAGTITGSTLQTSESGERFVVSSSTNEAQFFGDPGNGDAESLLCTIGVKGESALIFEDQFTTSNWGLYGNVSINTSTGKMIFSGGYSLAIFEPLDIFVGDSYALYINCTSYTSGTLSFFLGSSTYQQQLSATGTWGGSVISTQNRINITSNDFIGQIEFVQVYNDVPSLDDCVVRIGSSETTKKALVIKASGQYAASIENVGDSKIGLLCNLKRAGTGIFVEANPANILSGRLNGLASSLNSGTTWGTASQKIQNFRGVVGIVHQNGGSAIRGEVQDYSTQKIANGNVAFSSLGDCDFSGGVVYFKSFTVSTLPSASTVGGMIYVSNESGGAVMAFSDGTNWRRVTDRAIVS